MGLAEHHERVGEVVLALADLPPAERESWLAANPVEAEVLAEALALLGIDDGATFGGAGEVVVRSFAADLAAHPETIGPWRILRRIGRGGMGEVFAARRPHPDREVALKVVRAGLTGPEALARFRFEIELLARLDHPGIVALLDAGITEDGEFAWFAMPLVTGAPLDVATRAMSVRERVGVMAKVCDAVAHAHARGIVHRDLKPANILVDTAGEPRILDFGIGRSATGESGQTRTGMVLGTVAYMSPEQARGDPASDVRTDVYALGVVLYELLAGRLPIPVSADLLSAIQQIAVREPDPLPDTLEADLGVIARTCLAKDPALRYATAHALADDLRRWLDHRPILARPPTLRYQAIRFAQRNRGLTAAAAIVALVAAIGLAGTLAGYRQARLDRDEALAAQARAQAVEDYLLVTFSAASQDRLGREASVGDAIDASLPSLDRLSGETKARVQVAIARLYTALERFREAAALVDAALTALRDPEDIARARLLRAELVASEGEEERGVGELAALSAEAAATWGPDAPLTVQTTTRWLTLAGARLPPAERLARAQALVVSSTRALGPDDPTTLDARGLLGVALQGSGQPEAAETELRAVLSLAEARHGVDGLDTLRRRDELLALLDDFQRHSDRIPLLTTQLAAQDLRLGPSHRRSRHTLQELGVAQSRVGQDEAARASFDEFLRRSEGARNQTVEEQAQWHSELAAAWRDLADPARSESIAREGLAIAAELPPSNTWRARLALHLARAIQAQGRNEDALPAFEAALPLLEGALGPGDEITLKCRKDLATTLLALKHTDEALAEFDRVVALATAHLGGSHVLVRAALQESGAALFDLGRYDEARAHLLAYRAAQDAIGKPATLYYTQVMLQLARLQRVAPDPSLAGVEDTARALVAKDCPADPACAKWLPEMVAGYGAP
jgi:tetratricopeptide (TPR) repeat protein